MTFKKNLTVACCKTCNLGKNILSYDEWLTYLNNLVNYRLKIKELNNVS